MSRAKPFRLATVFLTLLPLSAAADEIPSVSIHELKTHWQDYDGKRVQVRGQLNGCGPMWFCAICPEDMTRSTYSWNKCVAFSFEDQHRQDADMMEDVSLRKKYQFHTVTVEASFSASCLWDENGKPVGTVVCSDGPANLDNARVLEVHSQKNALVGLGETE
jgi:hypothetical protein